eukprot:5204135-Amphidinium_carterae.1
MAESEAETHVPPQGDVLGTSVESVVEPPVAKVRRIEPAHVPKRTYGPPPTQDQDRGYGPPTPPDENSDGDPAAHLRTREDQLRMLEDRLMTNEFEIDRRDAIRARNQANERRQEEQRQREGQQPEEQQQDIRERHRASPEAVAARPFIAKALGRHEDDLMVNVLSRVTDPNLENWYVPMPGPPRPPPPKQASASQQRDMEQAMAIAKAKNAAKIASVTSLREEVVGHAEGPRAVVKPPPTCPPKKPPGPFFASPHRSDDDEPTGLTVMSPAAPGLSEGNVPHGKVVMSPTTPTNVPHGKVVMSPTMPELSDVMVTPDSWEIETAAAAKQAGAVIVFFV